MLFGSYVPDHFKTKEICNDAVEKDPYRLGDVPARYKTARVCEIIIERDPDALKPVSNRLKTTGCVKGIWRLIHGSCIILLTVSKHMCDDVVRMDLYPLIGVPDYFVTSQQIKKWPESDHRNDVDVIRWYEGYQGRRPHRPH